MDFTTFRAISRSVATSRTRRSALRGLAAGAASLVAGGVLPGADDSSARRRKRGKGKGKKLQPGQRCQNDNQCPKGYICEVPSNGSNSAEVCSGSQGTVCGAPNGDGDDTAPFCAAGFDCTATGAAYTCQAVPEK
ncbi:MAG: hypothetical protein KC442_25625 [Thermomicrobiales bacterium]|nr:hypothetical protein [Thermomicrobiales bacterium]